MQPDTFRPVNAFRPVDLNWQVDKVTDINQMYNTGLNIKNNLPQTNQSPIDAPGKCEKNSR